MAPVPRVPLAEPLAEDAQLPSDSDQQSHVTAAAHSPGENLTEGITPYRPELQAFAFWF